MNQDSVNAWIFLNEDEPSGTNYKSRDSSYQRLIDKDVYQSVDILYLCFATILKTSDKTVPSGKGDTYTVEIGASDHPGGMTNFDYMRLITQDARKVNPDIQLSLTLGYGNGALISQIFTNSQKTPEEAAEAFAKNMVSYLKKYNLNGFDLDWEYPISSDTSQDQFKLLINAIGTEFEKEQKKYYLTISPAVADNLDADAINEYVDFINLQLYSGFTIPFEFTRIGINSDLFAYGAKFEGISPPDNKGYQTAEEAYKDNNEKYHYSRFTNWRLNSSNFVFEQDQQQQLYKLVNMQPVP